ncbi:MAG: phosphodiester glycosidase family protein [Clostridiales bacterium]|jgi:exopolysaccharide biosynthesis protein|nr:phosphodiester glycosidase family protein [Clostridiales bacterium]
MNKLSGLAAAFALAFAAVFAAAPPAFAGTTYYKRAETDAPGAGLVYEKTERATDAGILYVYTLTADISDPYISARPIMSGKDWDLKETVTALANQSGAAAAVNGDFFGTAGKYSIPMGLTVSGGEILSLTENSNRDAGANASLVIDKDESPLISYISSKVSFFNNGQITLDVDNINIAGANLNYPTVITRAAMDDTKSLDARIPGIYKIVCQGEIITYISGEGESVAVPSDGFVVAMDTLTAERYLRYFAVGQRGVLGVSASVDMSGIESAITGGGKLLERGAIVSDGGEIPSGLNPRTAVGITADREKLILMAVDGRGASVGADREDLAALMLEYGAYEALAMDGGGSTAMAVRKTGADSAALVNKPSDGAERPVINALGIFVNAPVGPMTRLVVSPWVKDAIRGNAVGLTVYGADAYNRRIEAPVSDIRLSSDGGGFDGNWFIPDKTGKAVITAEYAGITAQAEVFVYEAAGLTPSSGELRLGAGQSAAFSVWARTTDNQLVPVSPECRVVPEWLGTVSDGTFTAAAKANGYIECRSGGAVCYIRVTADISPRVVTSFEGRPGVAAIAYPEGAAAADYAPWAAEGQTALRLSYAFPASGGTQAAYAVFDPPITIAPRTSALSVQANGVGSGLWLRGRISDADGREYTLDFARTLDWTGYRLCTAAVPAGAKFPIKIERIYVVSLGTAEPVSGAVLIDVITGVFDDTPPADVPDAAAFYDIYGGATGEWAFSAAPQSAYGYSASVYGQTLFITLDTSRGGLTETYAPQWRWLSSGLAASSAKNVVITAPLPPSAFARSAEADLLRKLLSDVRRQGRNVYYVVAGATGVSVLDGVRYITLADGHTARFAYYGNDLKYALE